MTRTYRIVLACLALVLFAAAVPAMAQLPKGYVTVNQEHAGAKFAPVTGFSAKAEAASSSNGSIANFLLVADDAENVYLTAYLHTPLVTTQPVTVRLAGQKVGKIHTGYSELPNAGASLGMPDDFNGLVTGTQNFFGVKQASVSGKYYQNTPFTITQAVMVPFLDAITSCDASANGDASRVWVGYRLRGYRPPHAIESGYTFSSDGFHGTLTPQDINQPLPAPVWIGIEVSAADYDAYFAGVHQILIRIGALNRNTPDNWYTIFFDRGSLSPCKG